MGHSREPLTTRARGRPGATGGRSLIRRERLRTDRRKHGSLDVIDECRDHLPGPGGGGAAAGGGPAA